VTDPEPYVLPSEMTDAQLARELAMFDDGYLTMHARGVILEAVDRLRYYGETHPNPAPDYNDSR
jgi:hypothetical protein